MALRGPLEDFIIFSYNKYKIIDLTQTELEILKTTSPILSNISESFHLKDKHYEFDFPDIVAEVLLQHKDKIHDKSDDFWSTLDYYFDLEYRDLIFDYFFKGEILCVEIKEKYKHIQRRSTLNHY